MFVKSDGMELSQVTNPLILLLSSTLYIIEKEINTFINSICTSNTLFLSFVKERECGVPAYVYTYLLTLWSRVLLQLLTGIKLLYIFFWVFPWRQIVVGRRFGTLCQFHLQRLDVDCEV